MRGDVTSTQEFLHFQNMLRVPPAIFVMQRP